MRSELRVMDLPGPPVGNGSGAALAAAEFRDMVAQVTGTFVATVTLEKSLDGSNWAAVSAGITAPGFIAVPQETIQFLRVTISGFTSETDLAVIFAGRDARSLG